MAVDEKARAEKQNQGDRHLGRNQRVSGSRLPRAADHGSAPFFEVGIEINFGRE